MSKFLSLVFVLAAACGGADDPAQKTEPQPVATDLHAVCTQAFQRQRECTDEYIPALVDARVRLNVPPGIADEDQELGRDELVARALEEWKADSTDEAIEQTCTRLDGQLPTNQQQQAKDHVGQCLAADTCTAFVDCMVPVIESMLR